MEGCFCQGEDGGAADFGVIWLGRGGGLLGYMFRFDMWKFLVSVFIGSTLSRARALSSDA